MLYHRVTLDDTPSLKESQHIISLAILLFGFTTLYSFQAKVYEDLLYFKGLGGDYYETIIFTFL